MSACARNRILSGYVKKITGLAACRLQYFGRSGCFSLHDDDNATLNESCLLLSSDKINIPLLWSYLRSVRLGAWRYKLILGFRFLLDFMWRRAWSRARPHRSWSLLALLCERSFTRQWNTEYLVLVPCCGTEGQRSGEKPWSWFNRSKPAVYRWFLDGFYIKTVVSFQWRFATQS